MATPPGAEVRDRALSTRDQLLRAVIGIAGEQGLSEVTYRSVAARATVTHGLVRHYFGTRQAMVDEALEQAVGDEISAVTLATGDPRAFAEGLLATDDEALRRRLLQYDVVLNAIRGTGDKELAFRLYDRYLKEISQTLDELSIADPDGSWAALLLVALDGLVLQQALHRDSERTQAALNCLRAVLSWLRSAGPASG